MRPGDVLLHAASWTFQAPGGGEVQLLQTGAALERQGIRARPFNPWTDRIEQARLLNLFGLTPEGLELARIARARRVPVVVSPICWFEPRAIGDSALSRLRHGFTWSVRRAVPFGLGWKARLLETCDLILPNSAAESEHLARLFGADPGRIHVVPNGVDPRFAEADPAPFRKAFGTEPFVLYVGRIEPRKNVLGLVRAARRGGWPLVVIGQVVPGFERYGERCRSEGRDDVRWLGRIEHDDPLLASAYAAARVFVLPSWFETPGLAALEAALAGCPVVITPFGSTREYFADLAGYARPDRPGEIAAAIASVWERGRSPGLAERVRARFLWSQVALETAEAYARVAP
jgi:glycosyltransferase involved in cell wall biosynthesis